MFNLTHKLIRRPAPMTLGKIKDKGGSKVKATKRGDDIRLINLIYMCNIRR